MGPKQRLRKKAQNDNLQYLDKQYVRETCADVTTNKERKKKRIARKSRKVNNGGKPTTRR